MKVYLKKKAEVNGVTIPPGDYMVALQRDRGSISLAGGGKDVLVPATRRPAKKPIRSFMAMLQPGMGPDTWMLLVQVPPKDEWIAYLRVTPGGAEE